MFAKVRIASIPSLALALAISQPAVAQQAETRSPEETSIALYAERYGVSQDEARARVNMMADLDTLKTQVLADLGDNFATGYFVHGAQLSYVARSSAPVRGQTRKEIRLGGQAGGTIQIEYVSGSPRAANAIRNIIENQTERLKKKYPDLQSLSYDPAKGKIILEIYAADLATAEAYRSDRKLEKISGFDGEIVPLRRPISDSAVRGGAMVRTPTARCTSGFGAKRGTQNGFFGATHCKGLTSYSDPLGSTHTISAQVTDKSRYHEVSFYPTNGTAESRFFWGNNASDYAAVTGYTSRSSTVPDDWFQSGQWACHYGKTTGYSCGTVQKINYQPIGSAGYLGCNARFVSATQPYDNNATCAATFIQVNGIRLNIDGGDSGGPVFLSNTAMGIASASSAEWFGAVDIMIYSSLDYVGSAPISASLLIEPR